MNLYQSGSLGQYVERNSNAHIAFCAAKKQESYIELCKYEVVENVAVVPLPHPRIRPYASLAVLCCLFTDAVSSLLYSFQFCYSS